MPPLMGWTAVTGRLDPDAFILFAIVFLWQFPHFLAIAWMYRDDYARAGLEMLTPRDATGAMTARQMLAYGLALVPVSLAPTLVGMAGVAYFVGALVLGLVFLALCVAFAFRATRERARHCLFASLVYLPAIMTLLLIDLSVE
jgi:protoheme IX farnesyltransferase